jgi:BirA family biotin operon repressor/biotin-[acetyl-CoA-carboxylase] ligase
LALDVDDNGALIIELTDGSIKKIIYGDCFHQ